MDSYIIVKATPGKLSALHKAMIWLLSIIEIENAYDDLIYHHAIEFKDLFFKAMGKQQKKYTFKFSPLQALAFCQMWHTTWKHLTEYEQVVVFEIFGDIDKQRKQIIIQTKSYGIETENEP